MQKALIPEIPGWESQYGIEKPFHYFWSAKKVWRGQENRGYKLHLVTLSNELTIAPYILLSGDLYVYLGEDTVLVDVVGM